MLSSRIWMILAAVFLLSACDNSDAKDQAQQGAAGAPPAMPVTVAKPLVQPVQEWREFPGRFEATDTVEVRSRVSGYLTQVLFTDGAIVHKGDPLFVIDPRPFQATLRQKQADKALAESKVTAAQNDYERAQALFNTGDISQSILDQRKATADSAKAAVASAQAAVDAAALDVTYTRITAPITGRISRNLVSVGNLVNPGQDVLTTIVSMDPIYFYFDVDEKAYVAYARLKSNAQADAASHDDPGIPVMVGLTDETGFPHAGKVDFIDNQLDQTTGTMRGRAVLENTDMFLTPGMFGRARIRTGTLPDGVLIPDEAVMIDQNRKLVFVVGANNIVESRTVETGPLDRGLRVITKGLDGSETVVINGLQRAHEGAPVAPQQGEIKPVENAAQSSPEAAPPSPADAAAAPTEAAPADKAPDTAMPAPAQPETPAPADKKGE
jgi:RND family efflux transporter MFP subunit